MSESATPTWDDIEACALLFAPGEEHITFLKKFAAQFGVGEDNLAKWLQERWNERDRSKKYRIEFGQ
jgi:hypothetical protein